ncbi:hypothetical protein [Bradyrhizobium sp. OAE829]|uniref:hypothetical protein n=1 Tax=Bradyrhizobium sp. OAE829 TaxID=2663807 RepID=UPI001788F454
MNFRVFALIVAVPFLAVPAHAQDHQAPISLAKMSPANVSPPKVSPQKVAPPKVAPAKVLQTQAPAVQQADVSPTEAPSFRKGLWRFIRTLDVVRSANKNIKYRVVDREMTRCVDPTHAMKTTFSSAPVGSCVSGKPEKVGNIYTFGHRCDYMGAVSTVITVHSDESYTEVNEVSTGDNPKTDLVTAKRIGDCDDERAEGPANSAVSSLQH